MGREALKSFARKTAVPLLVAAFMGAGSVTADAFTLVSVGKPKVTTSPTSGLATAAFTTRGKFVLNGSCPVSAPVSLTFKFFWYKVISSKVSLWIKVTNSCSANTYDTGNSPALHPPSPLNYPGTFVVQVAVYLTSNGAPLGTTYTDTTLYGVIAPKPSPKATPPRVRPSPSSSPSPAQCTAALPPDAPGGKDVEALLAVAGVGLLPIGGIAMMFSPGLWARRRDWAKLAAVLGLTTVMLISATACTPPNQLAGSSPETSPTQSVSSPSPSPTPSCQT